MNRDITPSAASIFGRRVKSESREIFAPLHWGLGAQIVTMLKLCNEDELPEALGLLALYYEIQMRDLRLQRRVLLEQSDHRLQKIQTLRAQLLAARVRLRP